MAPTSGTELGLHHNGLDLRVWAVVVLPFDPEFNAIQHARHDRQREFDMSPRDQRIDRGIERSLDQRNAVAVFGRVIPRQLDVPGVTFALVLQDEWLWQPDLAPGRRLDVAPPAWRRGVAVTV